MRVLVLLALALPAASALDSLPSAARFDAHEARLLVRLPEGGTLHVSAQPPVEAAVAPPGHAVEAFVPTPVEFSVAAGAPEASWHGLPGTVEVALRRAGGGAVRVELDDGGAGVAYDWPGAKETPALGVLAALAAVILAAPRLRRRAAAPRRGSA